MARPEPIFRYARDFEWKGESEVADSMGFSLQSLVIDWGVSAVAVTSQDPDDEAAQALDSLLTRIDREVEKYESSMRALSSSASFTRLANFKTWLQEEGQEIIAEILGKMRIADALTRSRMANSIRATERLADIAHRRDLSRAENLEMLRQWAEDALPRVRRAFAGFFSSQDGIRVDCETDEVLVDTAGPDRYQLVEVAIEMSTIHAASSDIVAA